MRLIMMIQFGLNVFAWQPSLSSQRVSVSPSVALHCKWICMSVCVGEDKKRGVRFYCRKVVCACAQHHVWCVFATKEMEPYAAFSVVSLVFLVLVLDPRQWPTTGHSREFVVSSFVTYASFWSFLTPWHWWGARTACVYVVHCLFGFCFECVCRYLWWKCKGLGEKNVCPKLSNTLFAFVITFMLRKMA